MLLNGSPVEISIIHKVALCTGRQGINLRSLSVRGFYIKSIPSKKKVYMQALRGMLDDMVVVVAEEK